MTIHFRFLFLLFFLSACQLFDSSQGSEYRQKDVKKIEIMSYNLENLFDTKHDIEGDRHLQDYMYLPKDSPYKRKGCQSISSSYWQKKCFETDWTEDKLKLRISQLSRVIKRGDKNKLPDILSVSEIENENVAQKLATQLNYDHFVLTSGEDERGIEVGVFYNKGGTHELKLIEHNEHKIPGRTTRSILEAQFSFNERDSFVLYVNHWPSQGSPSSARVEQAELLAELIKKKSIKSDAHVIAVGDFNTLAYEKPHPFNDALLKNTQLLDLSDKFHESSFVDKSLKSSQPLGTYFYAPKMSWNLLDRAFIGASLSDEKGIEVLPESYQIYAPEFAREKFVQKNKSSAHFGSVIQGVPKRASFKASTAKSAGFSDHFPLIFEIAYPAKN